MGIRSFLLWIGLVGCVPAVGADRDGMAGIAGRWIVEPNSRPGALLETITFTSGKNDIRGVWRAAGGTSEYSISDVKAEAGTLSFNVDYGKWGKHLWKGPIASKAEIKVAFVSEGRQATDRETRILRRPSRADIAEMERLEKGLI